MKFVRTSSLSKTRLAIYIDVEDDIRVLTSSTRMLYGLMLNSNNSITHRVVVFIKDIFTRRGGAE